MIRKAEAAGSWALLIVVVGALSLTSSCRSIPENGRSAAERLLGVRNFTFGPVGYGTGETTDGEKLYYQILRSPDALANFRYVWNHGNAQARAYALTAFWKLDRNQFARAAPIFIRESPMVQTEHVDIRGIRIPAGDVVEGIRSGVPSYRKGGRLW